MFDVTLILTDSFKLVDFFPPSTEAPMCCNTSGWGDRWATLKMSVEICDVIDCQFVRILQL